MLVVWIFLSGHLHPCKDNGTASGYNVHKAFIFLKTLGGSTVNANVDRHKIHTVLCVHFHDL